MGKLKVYSASDATSIRNGNAWGKGEDSLIIDKFNHKLYNGSSESPILLSTLDEADFEWAKKNVVGKTTPIDMAMSSFHSANRLAFGNTDGVIIEYSRDNGSTWNGYSTSSDAKTKLVSGLGSSYYIGGVTSGATAEDLLRITLDAKKMGVYTSPKKILLNISTAYSTGCKVKVEFARYDGPNNTCGNFMEIEGEGYTPSKGYDVNGWSGWNSIPIPSNITTFGGYENQYNNFCVIRFTFSCNGITNTSGPGLSVHDILLFGDNCWLYNSTMARTGHIYSYDNLQNAIFPASIFASNNITAKAFYESSDERLKDFKSDIKIDLDKLSMLPKKYFTWKNDNEMINNIGTSAQELQKLYPELVSESENGLVVDYAKLSVIALAAIDELHKEIKELKSKIE